MAPIFVYSTCCFRVKNTVHHSLISFDCILPGTLMHTISEAEEVVVDKVVADVVVDVTGCSSCRCSWM